MKFSILIAHYNNAALFKDCYESLLKQSYKNWEAVILDDASLEKEKEQIKQIIAGDERFRFFENEKNSGVGVTKSKLIELATGDICGFVDPDDAILPTAIEKSISIFRQKRDVVLAYSQFMTCNKDLQPVSPFKSAAQVLNDDPYFFNYPIQIAHFVTFRKDIYEQTEKMNADMKIAEDQDLYLKMYEKGKVQFINEPNYLYRTHSGGISQNDNRPRSREYFAQVIFNAMKRRGLKTIHGKTVPDSYTDPKEIFSLLEYQNKVSYRIKKKLRIYIEQVFG
ncbi:glycosyltransferase involved in cell wall biosynthesis [Chryseobacterium defluvii]|uniref:Glycosyltransferase involved in cell wall biosynthesis n=1 Tax=Chryseobacterium defluvii TaxID=160396 RepID=A0A840KB35_9FLAO|nr:glycosyltransferase family A protein [Chryseobacterium defluvii]MBB4806629.1 glycosyltransferase involved in cell wall biosynthesis [Chryseobacterium defluvii]